MNNDTTWEERFDKEFPHLIVSINESIWTGERMETDGNIMKSFIRSVLQEQKELIE